MDSLSNRSREELKKKGIVNLFPVQEASITPIMQGRDVVAKAKTGTGKTLAFVLPSVELVRNSIKEDIKNGKAYGTPRMLALAPTRELAKQISDDMSQFGELHNLRTVVVYGGASIGEQIRTIRNGVEIVVATPGRLLDLLERKAVELQDCRIVILDEADEMLKMGFKEDVEKILAEMKETKGGTRIQKLLFSATVPTWVTHLVKEFMTNPVMIDVTGAGSQMNDNRSNIDIEHQRICCHPTCRPDVISDLIGAATGKVLVFTDTKQEANELAANPRISALGVALLHGDISQNERERVTNAFKQGSSKAVIATDVAARGLHIEDITLVINSRPPLDHEKYVHRSGRTGRAGRKGKSIVFYGPSDIADVLVLEQKLGTKIQRVGPPTKNEMLRENIDDLCSKMKSVNQGMINLFIPHVNKILEEGVDNSTKNFPSFLVERFAAALYLLCGKNATTSERSILCCSTDYTTLEIKGKGLKSSTDVKTLCSRLLKGNKGIISTLKGISLVKGSDICYLDCPLEHLDKFLNNDMIDVKRATSLLPGLRDEMDIQTAMSEVSGKKKRQWEMIHSNKRRKY